MTNASKMNMNITNITHRAHSQWEEHERPQQLLSISADVVVALWTALTTLDGVDVVVVDIAGEVRAILEPGKDILPLFIQLVSSGVLLLVLG